MACVVVRRSVSSRAQQDDAATRTFKFQYRRILRRSLELIGLVSRSRKRQPVTNLRVMNARRMHRFLTPCAVLWLIGVGCGTRQQKISPNTAATDGPLLRALAALPNRQRTTLARLSVPVEYRLCEAITAPDDTAHRPRCGAHEADQSPSSAVLEIAARASEAVRVHPDADALHAAALIDLVWAHTSGNAIERSISYLETAARLTNRPTDVLTDLGAAYLIDAERVSDPRLLVRALDVDLRAIRLAPENRTVRFNTALTLDRLGLDGEAQHEWASYLTLDASSGWAEEARAFARQEGSDTVQSAVPDDRDTSALRRFAAASSEAAMQFGWDYLLPQWGEAYLTGDTLGARRRLESAAIVGRTLRESGGDCSLDAAVQDLRSTTSSPMAARQLAQAYRLFGNGRTAYRAANDYGGAGADFARVMAARDVSGTLRLWAMLFRGGTLVYTGRGDEGARLLRQVVARTNATRYPALAARARWALGTTLARAGQFQAALATFASAMPLARRARAWETLGALEYLTAEVEFVIHDNQAFAAAHQALLTLRSYRESVWLHNLLAVTASATASDGLTESALAFDNEDVAVADRIGRPVYAVEARLFRSELLLQSGDTESARADVDTARRATERLPSGTAREAMLADLDLATAHAFLRQDPTRARVAVDSAVSYFRGQRMPVREVPALVWRAAADLQLGDSSVAAEDLSHAMKMIDGERAAIQNSPLRASLMSGARGVLDVLLTLDIAAGRPTSALERLDDARQTLEPGVGTVNHHSAHSEAMPAAVGGIEYALVGDTLFTWTAVDATITLFRQQIDHLSLSRAVDQARASLELGADSAAVLSALAALYDVLIRPVANHLPEGTTRLRIVPDGVIGRVPFAALYDSTTRTFLIEHYAIEEAGSLAGPRPPRYQGQHDVLVAVVGDPAFDAHRFPTLPRLPGALDEADSVAADYSATQLLAGSAATIPAFESLLARATIVHFAGHALLDDDRPERSALLLASTVGVSDDGQLTAADIEKLNLAHVRLVVLSSCQTVAGNSEANGGLRGLVRAFVAAGAGGVVGSLWSVDDQRTRHLMVAFHFAYRASRDAESSLRAAQLASLHDADPAMRAPALWSAFLYLRR